MIIRFQRELMLAAFQTAAAVAPSRSPKPILQNVKLMAKDGAVTLLATDLEVGVRIDLQEGLEVDSDGAAVLPVDRFGSILRESADDRMTLTAAADGNEVRGQRSRFKLPAHSPDEFPQVAQFDADAYHEVSARLWKEIVRRTLFATDTESSRYALGGVLLEFAPDAITAVGTDGRRLAKMLGPAQAVAGHATGDRMTIMPARSMQLIDRSLSDADSQVQLATRDNDILVRIPHATFFSRLVEGRFPKWRDVLPEKPVGHKIDLTVGPTYAALRQAAIVSNNESRGISFIFGEGALVLTALTAEVGESRVELPIAYDGQPITVKLDHRYVADFLRALPAEKNFSVHVKSGEAAALFSTDDGYEYVVMPMAAD